MRRCKQLWKKIWRIINQIRVFSQYLIVMIWKLTISLRSFKKVFIFGVKDFDKARLVAISCLEFQKAHLPFTSLVVHEDFENLPKKDRVRITLAVDKQFINLDDFRNNGLGYLQRTSAYLQ